MDLRDMLNGSEPTASRIQSQPPPQGSPLKPSYTSYSEPPRQDVSPPYPSGNKERPPQPPPLYTHDSRSPSGSSPYTSAHSPYQHNSASTSTLSGGLGTYPASSPGQGPIGQHPPVQTAHPNSYNAGFVPSPSPLAPQPTTPGPPPTYANQYRPQSSHSHTSPSPSYSHSYLPREGSASAVPPPTPQNRPPYGQHSQPPGTPLGPPAPHQRPSPQMRRHQSDYEHIRTYSSGSHDSVPQPDPGNQGPPRDPRDPIRRQYSFERERERTQSVSPKTILGPGQQRQRSTISPQVDRSTLGRTSHDRAMSEHRSEISQPKLLTDQLDTPVSRPISSQHQTQSSPHSSIAYQSPVQHPIKTQTPRMHNQHLPGHDMSETPSLKRASSAISGSTVSPQPPPRKRLRYDEIPKWARSAREEKFKKPIIREQTPHKSKSLGIPDVQRMESEPEAVQIKQEANGHPAAVMGMAAEPPVLMGSMPWEPSIQNVIPYEDLTRLLCDQIFAHIGTAEPPSGGAKFEIEAKLGEIQSRDEHTRIRMPVLTECLIDRNNVSLPQTRFESSMTVVQHKSLNEFLNDCLIQTQRADREMMHHKHTREIDNFYDLTPAGRQALPPHLTMFTARMHQPRVRITTDRDTGMVVAKIIKCRMADFDIYNPRCAFDYRISVNLECPWNGPDSHLVLVNETEGRRGERQKDRMSYRHLYYQIDLTQVSYPQTSRQEHELEIEVAPEALRGEIQLAREGKAHRYEDLVRGFVDNVRVLSRRFPAA